MNPAKKILLASAMASLVLHAARPLAETQRIMKDNAYVGVWEERHDDDIAKLAFTTNAWAVLDYRGYMQHFRWKSAGDGKVEFFLETDLKKPVARVKYFPEQDCFDLDFKGERTRMGFSGRLAFKSVEVPVALTDYLVEATAKKPTRESRFEELKCTNDPRLRRVTNLKELVDPEVLTAHRESIETVDLEYPRIVSRGYMSETLMFLDIYYGAHEESKISEHECNSLKGRLVYEMPDRPNEIGIPRAMAEKARDELVASGVEVEMYCREYGEGRKKWREEAIGCFVRKNDRDKVAEIVARYFIDDRPRYVLIDKADYFEKPKTEADAGSASETK